MNLKPIIILSIFYTIQFINCHVRLTFPPARKYDFDFLDNVRTGGPCGMNRGFGPNTELIEGTTINVTWHLAYAHRGGYRLEILKEDNVIFSLTEANKFIGVDDGTRQYEPVNLPNNFTCSKEEKCSIRLLRNAAEWSASSNNPYLFWSCADITILPKSKAPLICPKPVENTPENSCKATCTDKTCNAIDPLEICNVDADCGGDGHGKCETVAGFTKPKNQCFCSPGFMGIKCQEVSPIKSMDDIDINKMEKYKFNNDFTAHYRILKETNEIETVLIVNGTSWVAMGWRPTDITTDCKMFPQMPVGSKVTSPVGNTPTSKPESELTPEPSSNPESELTPEPSSNPESELTPVPTSNPESELTPVPTSNPESKLTPEPSSNPESELTPVPTSNPESELTPEPSSNPESELTPVPTSNPESELTPVPTSNPESELTPEPSSNPESELTPEPSSNPESELTPVPTSNPESEQTPNPTSNPESELTPEPTSNPESEINPEPSGNPESEQTPKPTSNPESELTPEPSGEPEGDGSSKSTPVPESEGEATPSQNNGRPSMHPMDCTDIIVGSARDIFYNIGDFYTRDRSTPQRDEYFDGKNSLTATYGFEKNGVTTIVFRRKIKTEDRADHEIVNDFMNIIYAKGQIENSYVHNPPSSIESKSATDKNFYRNDEVKYHGSGSQRGTAKLNFFEETEKYGECPKNYFEYPINCDANKVACQYMVSWDYNSDTDKMMFEIKSKQDMNRWTAVGFGKSSNMENVDVIIGVASKNIIWDAWISTRYSKPKKDDIQNLEDASISYKDGIVTMKFSRLRSTGDSNEDAKFSDTNCFRFFFPFSPGTYENNDLKRHAETPIVSANEICLKKCLKPIEKSTIIPTATNKIITTTTTLKMTTDMVTTKKNNSMSTILTTEKYESCPRNKFEYPKDCDANKGDCQYSASWDYNEDTDKIMFEIKSKQDSNKWTSIGFAKSPKMENVDVIIGVASQSIIWDAWIMYQYSPPKKDAIQNLEDASISHENGVSIMKFTRLRSTGDSNEDAEFSDTNCFWFLFPVSPGTFISNNFNKHIKTPIISDNKICLKKCLKPTEKSTIIPTATNKIITTTMKKTDIVTTKKINSMPTILPTEKYESCPKNTFEYPKDCDVNKGDCQYSASWDYNEDTDKIMFEIKSKQDSNKWTSIGFAKSPIMEYVDVVIGVASQNIIWDSWIIYRYSPPNKDATQNLEDASISYENGVSTMKFTRLRSTGDSNDAEFSDSNCFYFLFPVSPGTYFNNNFNKHMGTPIVSDNKICIKKCLKSTVDPKSPTVSQSSTTTTIKTTTTTQPKQENLPTVIVSVKVKLANEEWRNSLNDVESADRKNMDKKVKAAFKMELDDKKIKFTFINVLGYVKGSVIANVDIGVDKGSNTAKAIKQSVVGGNIGDLPVDNTYFEYKIKEEKDDETTDNDKVTITVVVVTIGLFLVIVIPLSVCKLCGKKNGKSGMIKNDEIKANGRKMENGKKLKDKKQLIHGTAINTKTEPFGTPTTLIKNNNGTPTTLINNNNGEINNRFSMENETGEVLSLNLKNTMPMEQQHKDDEVMPTSNEFQSTTLPSKFIKKNGSLNPTLLKKMESEQEEVQAFQFANPLYSTNSLPLDGNLSKKIYRDSTTSSSNPKISEIRIGVD